MFENIKNLFKWKSSKYVERNKNQKSFLLCAYLGILEDILLWKFYWLSLFFILFLNLIFFVCLYKQISLLRIFIFCGFTALGIDALEMWLKYKHRTTVLKKMAKHDGTELNLIFKSLYTMVERKCSDLIFLREKNPTKAFLLVNITLSILFFIGTYVDGYLLLYLLCMFLCVSKQIIEPLQKVLKKMQQHAESDAELEGLIPEVTEGDIKFLSIEPEHNQDIDEKQSLDFWKPDDLPLDEASDSSDNSSSLASNLTMGKMHIEKDIETSDSSEDEYIPLVKQRGQLQTTLEVSNPTSTWGSSAYNTFWNVTGAITNMVYTSEESSKRKRVSSIDSSDGFEMVDKNDL